jgi:hypothetical protein
VAITAVTVVPLASALLRFGTWSAAGAISRVFWLFHFGLIASLALGLVGTEDLTSWDREWLSGPYAQEAAVLATAGFLALLSGIAAVRSSRGRVISSTPKTLGNVDTYVGAFLLIGAVALWAWVVLTSGGASLFFSSYSEYLDATSGSEGRVAFAWLMLGIGVVITAAARPTLIRRLATGVTVLFAAIALALGLRGELLFPVVGALVALTRMNRPLPKSAVWMGMAVILLVIPVVREVRTVGLRSIGDARLQPNMIHALVEMGGSLHPVEKAVRWRSEGDPLLFGGSYWAPFERAAARVLPQIDRDNAENDDRIMNVLVTARVGPIGFSPVAEAYRNFGLAGPALVLFILGMIVSSVDTIAHDRRAVVCVATILVPLLVNVRNSFVSVPMQCIAGLLFLTVVAWLGRIFDVSPRPIALARTTIADGSLPYPGNCRGRLRH